jgi:flavorubredoxin
MAVRKLVPNVHSVGAIDWGRKIFDELIPLPDGTSYNAYIVKGSEKTALIDTVDPEKEMELLVNLHELGIEKIDYIITNHAEQDHSGAIPLILEHFPEAVVVTNQKCKSFEIDHLYIHDSNFKVIHDGDTLSLGDKTLKFIMTPWVHWPETMVTYL